MTFLASFFSPYPVALVIHVLCASILIGSSVVLPLARKGLVAATTTRELATWLTFSQQATRWHPLTALILLLTGGYMGTVSQFYFDGWFLVAIAGWLTNATLAARVLHKVGAQLGGAIAAATEPGITAEMDALRRSTAWTLTEDIMRAIDVALLYLMFNKPTLADSLAVVVAAGFIAAAVRLAMHARGERTPVAATAVVSATARR